MLHVDERHCYRHRVADRRTTKPLLWRRATLTALSIVGSSLVVLGAALPWLPSGAARYSAFRAARAAYTIDLFDSLGIAPARFAVIALLFTPVVVPAGVIALSVGWRRIGAALLFIVGLLGLLSGGLVVGFSSQRLSGPIVAIVGGAVATVSTLLLGFARKGSERQ